MVTSRPLRTASALILAAFAIACASQKTSPSKRDRFDSYKSAVEGFLTDAGLDSERDAIRRWLKLSSEGFQSKHGESASKEDLAGYLFLDLGMTADTSLESRSNILNILPNEVIRVKRGHCIGLSTITLLLAEQVGLKASLVRAPDHAFVRLCDRSGCGNAELLRNGTALNDEYYVSSLGIPTDSVKAGIYLSPESEPIDLYVSLMTAYGYALHRSGLQKKALAMYEKAIEMKPWAETLANRAALQFELNHLESVSADLIKATSLNPYLYSGWLNLAVLQFRTGDTSQALESSNRALKLKPTLLPAWLLRGRVLLERQFYDSASEAFRNGLAISSDSCPAIDGLVKALEGKGTPGDNGELEQVLKKRRELKKSGHCKN